MMADLEAAQKVIDDDDEFVRVDWDFHMTVANASNETPFRWKLDRTCTKAPVLLRPQPPVTGLASSRT